MGSDILTTFPYVSLDKYTEALVQCPICHYYLKINPQSDTMQYKLIAPHKIQFLTYHQLNTALHSLIVEFDNFTFSKIISYSDQPTEVTTKDFFPLYHVVALTEYLTFRDRVLDLEQNNNELIRSFKHKLDGLEASYKQTELDNTRLLSQVTELTDLKTDFEALLAESMLQHDKVTQELTQTTTEKEQVNKQLKAKIQELEEKNTTLSEQLTTLQNKQVTTATPDHSADQRLRELLEQERHQKREAVKEAKELTEQVKTLEYQYKSLQETYELVEQKFRYEEELKEKTLLKLQKTQETFDQSTHALTLDYEQKISDLTLALQDREDQLLTHKTASKGTSKRPSAFDKQFREQIAEVFLKVQKRFNTLHYDLMLSFYDAAHLDNQLRNAFEQFFLQLITKGNTLGQILLVDPEFTLFKDVRELTPRLRFTADQQQASLQLLALEYVLSDLLKYIFSIIKAMKAREDGENFVIIPDDADLTALIPADRTDEKITFHIPLSELTTTNIVQANIRVFRPTSELFRDSFVFIAKEDESHLNHNTYELLPFEIQTTETEILLTVANFFAPEDRFEMGSFYDGQFFMIQRLEFQRDFNVFRNYVQQLTNQS